MARVLALATVAVALLLNGCGGSSEQAVTSPSSETLGPSTRLVDLAQPGRTAKLFSLFNADQGLPRLVLLVSPT
jgi:hypothetical protein